MGLQEVESSGCAGYIMTLSLFCWKQFEAFWGSVWADSPLKTTSTETGSLSVRIVNAILNQ